MKLGDAMRKERERRSLAPDEVASRLEIPIDDYLEIEAGNSEAEEWVPKRLAQIAIKLKTPTSRLISQTGKFAQSRLEQGQCGKLIRMHRESKQISKDELARMINAPVADIELIEDGRSPLEKYGPLFLGFAEIVDMPVFNLFYPYGLPLESLPDYP